MTDVLGHFEDLWEQCENLQKEASQYAEVKLILDELVMKLGLYQTIDTQPPNSGFPEEERSEAKSRAMGEILLTLTCLSMKDNINVFEALQTALYYRTIQHLDQQNPI